MEKSELIKKIFNIILDEKLDIVDKLIDIYVLINNEEKQVKQAEKEKTKDITKKEKEEVKNRKKEEEDFLEKIKKQSEDAINSAKFGKYNDECLVERFAKRYPGKPIFISCRCSRCNHSFISPKYTW